MVVASAAFRREQHQDWFVQQPQGTSKDSFSTFSSTLQDFKSQLVRRDVDAISTATLTSDDNVVVRTQQQDNLPQRIQVPQPQRLASIEAMHSVFYGTSLLPPPPPPPPPPPLTSVIATSAMLSTVSPVSSAMPRTGSGASSSHNSLPLPAHAHWRSLRRFVVLPHSHEDILDAVVRPSNRSSSQPLIPPPAPPKPTGFRNKSAADGVNTTCDDDVGVAGLASFLESITSLCVGEDDAFKSNLRRQRQQRRHAPSFIPQQYAPPPAYRFEDDINSIQDDENCNEEEDSLSQLPPAATLMKRQQQSKSTPPIWSHRKSVIYPIASYPARLNSKTLVEQRRHELKQDSFFRPISEDEASVQPQHTGFVKLDAQRSF